MPWHVFLSVAVPLKGPRVLLFLLRFQQLVAHHCVFFFSKGLLSDNLGDEIGGRQYQSKRFLGVASPAGRTHVAHSRQPPSHVHWYKHRRRLFYCFYLIFLFEFFLLPTHSYLAA